MMNSARKRKLRVIPDGERGSALILVALAMLTVLSLAVSGTLFATTQTRDVARYEVYKDEFAASEIALNKTYAHLDFLIRNNLPNFDSQVAALTAPVLQGFDMPSADFVVTKTFDGVDTPTTGPNAFMPMLTKRFNVTARAKQNFGKSLSYTHPGVRLAETLECTWQPLHMYAIFYDQVMEIAPSPLMRVTGRVHSNGALYIQCGAQLDFQQRVTAAGNLYYGRSKDCNQAAHDADAAGNSWGGTTDGSSTTSDGQGVVNFTTDGTANNLAPMKVGTSYIDSRTNSWLTTAQSRWNNFVADRSMGVAPLNLPIPTGVSPHVVIERRGGASSSAEAAKLENQATLRIIRNPSTGVIEGFVGANGASTPINLTYPNPANPSQMLSVVSTSSFYDFRQQAQVTSIDVDLSRMRQSMTTANPIVPSNGLLYVSNDSDGTNPNRVVRIVNGSQLPVPSTAPGFSVATSDAVYVKGDYNSVWSNTNVADRPLSMVAGDALMILSSAWSDGYNASSNTSTDSRVASNTITNAVFLTGNVPSGSTDATPVSGRPTYFYSGGVENYYRYLEKWTGINHTFNGSMITLFASTKFRARWNNNGNIYNPPNRLWSWDTNLGGTASPPGALRIVTIRRTSWSVS